MKGLAFHYDRREEIQDISDEAYVLSMRVLLIVKKIWPVLLSQM